jgi:hypothetical protein
MTSTRYNTMQTEPERLTSFERAARIVVGAALMSSVFFATGPLDWAVALPLLAVYPLLTGVMGIEPLRALLARGTMIYRAAQFAVGGALVGSIFAAGHFSAVPLGEFMILPLVGIYYVLAGIMGRAPIASAEEVLHEESAIPATAPKIATIRSARA